MMAQVPWGCFWIEGSPVAVGFRASDSASPGGCVKAIICTEYGPPQVLQLRDIPKPEPQPDQLLVRVFATAVTSSDCFVRSGKVSPAFWLPMRIFVGFSRPRQGVLGMVFSGEVESVGEKVLSFKPGDHVFGFDRFAFGTYAQYKCIGQNGIVAAKPPYDSHDEAAAVPYGGLLALSYLQRANLTDGERVLIYGASGAVGTSAVQIAKHLGAIVTAASSASNLELVRALGPDVVVDYAAEQAAFEPFDLIFDAVGKRKSSAFKLQCRKWLSPTGQYLSVDDGSPILSVSNLLLLKTLVEQGKIKPVIDRTYPLEKAADAHAYVEQGHKKGNVILTVTENALP